MIGDEVVEAAAWISDQLLFPAALEVDAAAEVPTGHLDALAAAGLYGVAGPAGAGGSDLELPVYGRVIEALAGGCLATTFVWLQHHGTVRGVAAAQGAIAERWLAPLCAGTVRAGVVQAGPRVRAVEVDGGWELTGASPWVTGWGRVDVINVLARGADGDAVVSLLVDARPQPGLTVYPQDLVAVNASATVELAFDRVHVPADRLIRVGPLVVGNPAQVLRMHASLALGMIGRCARIVGAGPLDDALEATRAALDAAAEDERPDRVYAARAAVGELAVRAAAATVVHTGSRAVRSDSHAQRLAREATFLLVFGTRPPIRDALVDRLTAEPAVRSTA